MWNLQLHAGQMINKGHDLEMFGKRHCGQQAASCLDMHACMLSLCSIIPQLSQNSYQIIHVDVHISRVYFSLLVFSTYEIK
jgi:hypothetical protein